MRYVIGGHEYNLQDIENGVLRANRRGVGELSDLFILLRTCQGCLPTD